MARFSGNRFGGGYGGGSDSLDNKMLRNGLLSMVRSRLGNPQMPSMAGGGVPTGGLMGMGFGGQPRTIMSSRTSTASETGAFNEK
jgi:hypothetical protein